MLRAALPARRRLLCWDTSSLLWEIGCGVAWRGTGYAGRWRCSQHVNARPTLAFIHGGPFDTNMYQPAGILEPWRRHCLVCACKGHRHTHAHAHMHPRSLAVRCVHSRRVKPHGTKRAVKALGKEKVAAGTRPASGEAAQGGSTAAKGKGPVEHSKTI